MLSSNWEALEAKLRRAPQDDSSSALRNDFNLLAELADKRGDLRRQITQNLDHKRKLIQKSIDLVRQIKQLSKERNSNKRDTQVVEYGVGTRALLHCDNVAFFWAQRCSPLCPGRPVLF